MIPLLVCLTASTAEEARKIADALVEECLAVCAQVGGPVQSTYHWQGKVETASEFQVTLKTSRELWDQLRQRIRSLHSYDCPEIIAVTPEAIDPDYLAWWQEGLRGPSGEAC